MSIKNMKIEAQFVYLEFAQITDANSLQIHLSSRFHRNEKRSKKNKHTLEKTL